MRKWIALAAFLFFTAGCGHYNIPVVDVVANPPDVIQQMPLNVAILMTDQMENFIYTGNTDVSEQGTFSFPLGQMIKKNSLSVLSPAFNKAVIVKGKPYPEDTDVIIMLNVENFKHSFQGLGPMTSKVLARVSVGAAMYQADGKLIWKDVVNSPVASVQYSAFSGGQWMDATGKAAAESVVGALQETAKAMTAAQSVQAFISSRGVAETAMAEPSGKKPAAAKSDVDELPAVKVQPDKNAYAVVIGIENYRQKLPRADHATHDARTVSEYLVKAMGYPEENVVTLLNETALKSDLEKYFDRWLSNNVEDNARVFIYFSGHGAPSTKTGDAYLVPYDGDPTFIAETGYPLARLYGALGKLKAKEIVVVLDSCFSGSGGRSVIAKGAKPLVITVNAPSIQKNTAVLTASSADQISSAYEEKHHGLLTYFLLKGIKEENVLKPDGSVAIAELFSYVKPQVERIARKQFNNEQTPQLFQGKTLP